MIAAILLAAGNARRFDGSQKLLATVPYEGRPTPLVRVTAAGIVAAKLQRIVVVTGRDAALVSDALAGLNVALVENQAYAAGMSGSLRVGVSEALRLWPDLDGVLIALGDQPLGGTEVIERLVAAFDETGGRRATSIVAPRFRGLPGNPVVFGRKLVPELLAIVGDRGARSVVEREPSRVEFLDFDRQAPVDVDTPEDLLALTRLGDA